jgi:DNA topoisomerase-2
MIIDGTLIISKRAKSDLIAELKEKGFKAFPKIADAVKAGENQPAGDDEDETDGTGVDSTAYNYLLGVSLC